MVIIIHPSLGSRSVPWLGQSLSMPSPPVLRCPLPYRVAPVFVQVVSPPLGWSGLPCRLFLSDGLQVMTCEVHRSFLRQLISNFKSFSQFSIKKKLRSHGHFCPLSDPDVLSLNVMSSIFLYVLVKKILVSQKCHVRV